MEILIALVHFAGAIIVWGFIGFLSWFISEWGMQRVIKYNYEEGAIKIGVPLQSLDSPEYCQMFDKVLWDKYSSELLRNRISDVFGRVQSIWMGFGMFLQIAGFAFFAWLTIVEGSEAAVFAWTVVVVALLFSISKVILRFFCKLFTGRYPGEAVAIRKGLSQSLAKGYWSA